MKLKKIISGGQTGVDRGALDAAIYLGLDHGGWCPSGRKAEDGVIPVKYQLRSTWTGDYHARTRLNVEEADATIVFTKWEGSAGSDLTQRYVEMYDKPCLIRLIDHVVAAEGCARGHEGRLLANAVRAFLEEGDYEVVNVAGPRESKLVGVQAVTFDVLQAAIRLLA